MYFSVTASMKDLFSPITVSLFSVILQCFIIYVLWVLYSWLLRCDCCQNWQMCFFYTNELYTQQNSLTPKCAFYYRLLCVKVVFFSLFVFFFILNLFWSLEEKKLNQNCCHNFVVSFYIFSYLVAIKDFLIFEMFQCCCVWCLFLLFLPSVSLTLEVGWDD